MQRSLTRLLRVPAFLMLLAGAAPAQTTWYVDASNTPPGSGTPSDPYASLQHAVDQSTTVEGDTLLVAPGVYSEASGHLSIWKTLTVRSAEGPLVTHIRDTSVHLEFGAFDTLLEGFSLSHPAPAPLDSRLVDAHSGTLRRCILHDSPAHTAVFTVESTHIVECTIVRNRRALSGFGLGYSAALWNTIVWDNALPDFGENTWPPGYSAGAVPATPTNVPGDPGFVDLEGGDYHLAPGSPCIDAGDPASPPDPDGSPIDIGALTFQPPDVYAYCEAAPNSFDAAGARIGWSGSIGISAGTFTLEVSGAPPGQMGKFYYGPVATQVPFGDGYRCVGAGSLGLFRLYPPQPVDATGQASRLLDFTSPPAGSGQGAIAPGSTWKFQYWFRDPLGPGGSGHNLSDGLSVTFGA